MAYLRGRGKPEHSIGHSPIGAGSVFALLGFLGAQVATGLLSDDEIAFSGPLTKFVSGAVVNQATWYHKAVGQWVIITLVVVHIIAVLFYLWGKRRNLITPMVVGDKHLDAPAPASRDDAVSRGVAAVVMVLCGAGVAWVVSLGN
jgi:cytochrome b